MKFHHWIIDYLHTARGYGRMFWHREPAHYRGFVVEGKAPVILVPGLTARWQALKKIGDVLSLGGHPVYLVRGLGFMMKRIPVLAKMIRKLIDEQDLKNVILVAHSKGGLVGKYFLDNLNADGRMAKIVAIASPFQGSRAARIFPFDSWKEVRPESQTIRHLLENKSNNGRIVSIYGTWDNHVWPVESCYLEGAKNMQVDVSGHTKILADKQVLKIVEKEVNDV